MELINFQGYNEYVNEKKNDKAEPKLEKHQEEIIEGWVIDFIETNEPWDHFYYTIQHKLNEGWAKRVFGGLTGLALGKAIGKFLGKALGLKEDGELFKILTSRAVGLSIGLAVTKTKKK